MIDETELMTVVETAFADSGRGLAPWPDPHPDRLPLDEEYSRLLDPAKWRIVGARADAWVDAVVEAGLAVVQRDAAVAWRDQPGPVISRTDRVVPHAAGALPLIVARSRFGGLDDAGLVVGVGDPAVCVNLFPDCGCDACDSGSQNELDHLDAHILSIVSGSFRRLSDGAREITVIGNGEWSAHGRFGRRKVDAVLRNPAGWNELTGASWLSPPSQAKSRP